MRFPVFAAVLLASVFAFACGGEPRNEAVGEWDLVALMVDGAEVPALEEARPVLTLDADVSGDTGCNTFKGQYEVEGDSLTFSEFASTLRACEAEDWSEQETRFLLALDNTATFEREGDELRFFDSSGALLARFEK